jgi:hypothetical protein
MYNYFFIKQFIRPFLLTISYNMLCFYKFLLQTVENATMWYKKFLTVYWFSGIYNSTLWYIF